MARKAIAYERSSAQDTGEALVSPPRNFDTVAVVRDDGGPDRSGLTEALGQIAAGEASTLVATRLSDVAGSLRELTGVLDWLGTVHGDLVARDVNLDTRTAAGRRSVELLREVDRWEGELRPGRPPRGRPGLAAQAPELSARIIALREAGLSLQAIADALNADGVPTRRGGARWRPSSVQAAVGYRRPRPPAPGIPPPPRHPPERPPHPPSGADRAGPAPGTPRPAGRGRRRPERP